MELWINHVQINHAFETWNDRNLAKISQKLRTKWNFKLTVFELTVPDLYHLFWMFPSSGGSGSGTLCIGKMTGSIFCSNLHTLYIETWKKSLWIAPKHCPSSSSNRSYVHINGETDYLAIKPLVWLRSVKGIFLIATFYGVGNEFTCCADVNFP